MSGLSPASVLFSSDGYEVAVINGNPIPSSTRGYLFEGSDGSNSRFVVVDTSGRLTTVGAGTAGSPAGGVITIQGVSGGMAIPVSGTIATTQSGAWTNTVTQATASSLNATVVGTTAAGSGSSTGLVTIQGNVAGTPVPVSGTVTTTNSSVALVATTPPTSATYIGASATTTAPTYTTGQMNPLSITTGGLLRIDGVFPINATTPTSDITFVGGAVTTSAPTYTTGQLSALSLDTTGNVRALANQPTASNLNATVVGSGSAGTPATGVLTVQGITGGTRLPVVSDNSTISNLTSVALSASSVTLLAVNAARVSACFYNDSTSVTMYLALSAVASTTAYTTKLLAGDYWELPISYTGAVSAICNSSSGNCRITELS